MAEEGARGIAREIEINGDDASLPEISARSQDCRRRCRRRRRRQRRRQRGYKYQPLWPLLGSFFLLAIPLFSPSLSRAGKIDRGRERENCSLPDLVFPSYSVLLDVPLRHFPSLLLRLLSWVVLLLVCMSIFPPQHWIFLSSRLSSLCLFLFFVLLISVWLMLVCLYSTICI